MNRRIDPVTATLLIRRAAALKRHLAAALEGDVHGVHQARVASRRLREAVPVLTSGVKGTKAKKARGKIRRLTRALGGVRELDVTLQVLDELTATETLPRQALEEVRGHVVAERDARRAAMLKRLEQVKLEKLERRLAFVGEALAQSDAQEWRSALGSRLLKRQKALGAAIADAGQIYSPEHLHQVRIASKKLRYALELAVDAGIKSGAAPLRTIKRAQDTLGRLHDLQVLQHHVAAVQASPVGKAPSGGLEIVNRALEDQCRHLHASYIAMLPKLAGVLDAVRTVVVPQLAARSRTPLRALKMTLKPRTARRVLRAASGGQR